jgi:hypothetical protein
MIPPSESLVPLLGANPPEALLKMKNILSEPILSLTTTIIVFLLSFTGSIFLVLNLFKFRILVNYSLFILFLFLFSGS